MPEPQLAGNVGEGTSLGEGPARTSAVAGPADTCQTDESLGALAPPSSHPSPNTRPRRPPPWRGRSRGAAGTASPALSHAVLRGGRGGLCVLCAPGCVTLRECVKANGRHDAPRPRPRSEGGDALPRPAPLPPAHAGKPAWVPWAPARVLTRFTKAQRTLTMSLQPGKDSAGPGSNPGHTL